METQTEQPLASTVTTWKEVLGAEKEKQYFKDLLHKVAAARAQGKTIYPPQGDIFNALQFTPFDSIRAVIIGQDPYHGPGQAHGLCFSVQPGVPPPPSLINIYKELSSDLNTPIPNHGCLEQWARQGVLLLNAVLTVEAGKPQSHAGIGWEQFTDKVISEVSARHSHIVFMLWGAYAQKKGAVVDRSKHLVLEAVHPSPLSAHRGFLGCRHFSKANQYLVMNGKTAIDWSIY
jgi:uracil-DNA glycosylase